MLYNSLLYLQTKLSRSVVLMSYFDEHRINPPLTGGVLSHRHIFAIAEKERGSQRETQLFTDQLRVA